MNEYDTLRALVDIDSPTGFTTEACTYIHGLLTQYGWAPRYTNKGAVTCALGQEPTLGITAHTDTLGAIVSGVNIDGTLRFSLLGGPVLPSFEGAYVRVHTLDGGVRTGTLLLNNPSTHANRNAGTSERSTTNMHIRLDERVQNEADVAALGINVGDIIAFDPRYQQLPAGFIKSHFMDNKAGCYVLFEIARRLKEQGRTAPVELFFSHYEEVGHGGAAGYAATVKDLLVVDMGVLGADCQGDEYSCSICAKDSSGPYDYEFRRRLVELARAHNIPYKIDVYPYYGSDGSAALRAGQDFRVALIGPGVAASHGVERAHVDGIQATINLCLAYIETLDRG